MRHLALALVGITLIGCGSRDRHQKKISASGAEDQTIVVPAFSISVKLSAAAEQRLKSMHESVLVLTYFDGDALPGQGNDNAPMRDVCLGFDERFVDAKESATFNGIKISRTAWNHLSNKNYFVTINVVSARKASKDNLLDCSDPEDRVSTFEGKTTQVSCQLIGEHDKGR